MKPEQLEIERGVRPRPTSRGRRVDERDHDCPARRRTLVMGIWRRGPEALLHYSDRGSQTVPAIDGRSRHRLLDEPLGKRRRYSNAILLSRRSRF